MAYPPDPLTIRSGADTTTVYKDGSLLHFPGANPGTPYTACGLDAGLFERREHPIDHAGVWCSACMQSLAAAR